jgi:alanyl-tRNA synthetase
LGDHVQQKGSLVDDAKTRFDFSHAKAMTADEIARVEAQVNADIGRDLPVFADHAAQDEARRIYGLRAVFGEKYPSVVRVVSVGVPVRDLLANPSNKAWYDYSVEFCGGTHLQSTGQAGTFVVVAEEAIAKGIRRITAVAGGVADAAQADGETVASELETLVAEAPGTLERKLADFIERSAAMRIPLGTRIALRERIAELQARIKEWKKTRTKNAESSIGVKAREMVEKAPEQRFYVEVFDDADKNALGAAIDEMRKIRPTSALMAASGSTMTGSFYIKAWVPRALTENGFYANEWVQFAAKRVGGGGGGKPDMAEAGGKYSPTWRDALEAAQEFAKKKLGAE